MPGQALLVVPVAVEIEPAAVVEDEWTEVAWAADDR
jgi:hypothetical protein